MEWLNEFWEIYKGDIMPVILTFITLSITALGLWIRTKLKVDAELAKENVKHLKNIENKEDLKPQIVETSEKVNKLSNELNKVAELVGYVFLQTDLQPVVKDEIKKRLGDIKIGESYEKIKKLESELEFYKKELESIEVKKMQPKEIKKVVDNTISKIRG